MNKHRKKEISKQINVLENAIKDFSSSESSCQLKNNFLDIQISLEVLLDNEYDTFNNMPEPLKTSWNGSIAADSIYLLSEAVDSFDTIIDHIDKQDVEKEALNDMLNNVLFLLEEAVYA